MKSTASFLMSPSTYYTTWTPFRYATPLIKPPRISQMLYLKSQRTSSVIFFAFKEDVFQDIGERKDALEAVLVIDDHKAMDSRLS